MVLGRGISSPALLAVEGKLRACCACRAADLADCLCWGGCACRADHALCAARRREACYREAKLRERNDATLQQLAASAREEEIAVRAENDAAWHRMAEAARVRETEAHAQGEAMLRRAAEEKMLRVKKFKAQVDEEFKRQAREVREREARLRLEHEALLQRQAREAHLVEQSVRDRNEARLRREAAAAQTEEERARLENDFNSRLDRLRIDMDCENVARRAKLDAWRHEADLPGASRLVLEHGLRSEARLELERLRLALASSWWRSSAPCALCRPSLQCPWCRGRSLHRCASTC